MPNVLIVSGHPRTGDDSVANKTILEELASLLPEVEIDHLDELYPDYVFDVEAEQEKLRAADVIVLQYPLWWYGWPALLQKWMEDVFVRGFSHGSTGTALRGKKLVVSVTTGASEAYYQPDSVDFNDLLTPAKATCALTGMEFAGSLPLFGVSYANRTDEAARADMVERSREHARRLAEFVSALYPGPPLPLDNRRKLAPTSCVYEAGAGSSESSESGESFDPGPQGVEDTCADGFATATATEATGRGKD